jgi:protoheme IX farnesyltransferase
MDKLKAYFGLTKPRITLWVLIAAVASFHVAGPPEASRWWRLAVLVVGVAMLAAGIFALNAFLERDVDLLMRRTSGRPLPAGRLRPEEALAFGTILTAISILLITLLLGWWAGGVALFTFVSYVLVYTPLKKVTAYHTLVGGLSGATPVLIGWAAARGGPGAGAWLIFSVLFLWQFPHFLAIQTLHAEDYLRAGIRVLPVHDGMGRAAARVSLAALVMLACASLAPFLTGMEGRAYLIGSIVVDTGFLAAGLLFLVRSDARNARLLLLASVTYLPLLFLLLALDSHV